MWRDADSLAGGDARLTWCVQAMARGKAARTEFVDTRRKVVKLQVSEGFARAQPSSITIWVLAVKIRVALLPLQLRKDY